MRGGITLLALLSATLAVVGCGALPRKPAPVAATVPGSAELQAALQRMDEANRWARRAEDADDPLIETDYWLKCAAAAHASMILQSPQGMQSALLGTACTRRFLQLVLSGRPRKWSAGRTRARAAEFEIEFRNLSPDLVGPLEMVRARDVPMDIFGGRRYTQPGFGVPLAIRTPRCHGSPRCELQPPEGVYRPAIAWVEEVADGDKRTAKLVIADPAAIGPLVRGSQAYPLAADTSAFYAWGAGSSSLRRLSVYGLIGGNEIDRVAGLYLLEDYDPHKRPIVMIHGLGASPLNWARLSNAIWGDPDLHSRYQVWHVVYHTDAPMLVMRARVQSYLDRAWARLDPEGDDPARSGVVLVGHSLGGVISRLLCVDSGDVLWNAAFTVPPHELPLGSSDSERLDSAFRFHAYPGVTNAIFLASPHHGSPAADAWWARMFRTLVGHRAPEAQVLRRLALEHPDVVQEGVRAAYQQAQLNSIFTLRITQPVREAAQSLLPGPGIPYHTIAGSLPGEDPPGDGFVPVDSAVLPGAASTLILDAGHRLYENDEAIAEVVRILREDRAPAGAR